MKTKYWILVDLEFNKSTEKELQIKALKRFGYQLFDKEEQLSFFEGTVKKCYWYNYVSISKISEELKKLSFFDINYLLIKRVTD